MIIIMLTAVMATAGVTAQTRQTEKGQSYKTVVQMPEYEGGKSALKKFLENNIKYPADAKAKNIHGRVIVQFVVDKEGNVKDAKGVKSVYPSLDAEALRVIKKLPKWKPGTQKGRAVNVKYTVPVLFSLPQYIKKAG